MIYNMPTYLYECEKCGRFEEFQRISEEPLTECPNCKNPVKRLIGAPGIIFKGSGFYSTDSRKSSNVINSKNNTDSKSMEKNERKEKKEKKDKKDNKKVS